MSRLHKISIIVFCVGLLLCGVGAGVMFTEFDKLIYGGKCIVGETDMRTDRIDVEFKTENEALGIYGVMGSFNHSSARIETDRSVPENTVRFCVTYNAKRVEPFARWSEEEGCIHFNWYWKDRGDEMALMMEAKDVVLRNLKEGRLVSCDVSHVEEVTVLVNPVNETDVRMLY